MSAREKPASEATSRWRRPRRSAPRSRQNLAIQAPNAQAILDRCIASANPTDCAAYSRSERGQITRFNDILDNLGTIKTDGWDVTASWILPERNWGRLSFDWKNTWVTRYQLTNESGDLEPRQPGIEVDNSAIPEWTSTLNTNWSRGPWAVTWTMRHISGLDESCAGANGFDICDDSANDINHLGAITYHDLQVSWQDPSIWKGLRFALGVNNLGDKNPPTCLSCSLNGYDASTYDLPGRFWYARLGFDF